MRAVCPYDVPAPRPRSLRALALRCQRPGRRIRIPQRVRRANHVRGRSGLRPGDPDILWRRRILVDRPSRSARDLRRGPHTSTPHSTLPAANCIAQPTSSPTEQYLPARVIKPSCTSSCVAVGSVRLPGHAIPWTFARQLQLALHRGRDLVERVAHVAHPLHGLPKHLLGRHHGLLVVCKRADRALQRRAH